MYYRILQGPFCGFTPDGPTDPFTNLELQNPSYDVPELHKTRRSSNSEALKLWKAGRGVSFGEQSKALSGYVRNPRTKNKSKLFKKGGTPEEFELTDIRRGTYVHCVYNSRRRVKKNPKKRDTHIHEVRR